ncbi:MAG: class D beta-lactamase [Acidobacteria bacterium]|nr:class D beta-lactamase [Acidobacteriota bacterium]
MIFAILLMPSTTGRAAAPDLGRLFAERGVEGTIVIEALDGRTAYVHNPARAAQRFLPASTFKIPHSLIALAEGAIADEYEVIPWDGKDRGFSGWNQDQTLATAFRRSCVWAYQELAGRVGNAAYLRHLARLDYGNARTGPNLRTFWLDGDLAISVREQITFLRKLYQEDIPYPKEHIRIVKAIMVVEETPGYILRAKTGWAVRPERQHGWYVGWVETRGHVWFFATNIAIREKSDAVYREEITRAALTMAGIM